MDSATGMFLDSLFQTAKGWHAARETETETYIGRQRVYGITVAPIGLLSLIPDQNMCMYIACMHKD